MKFRIIKKDKQTRARVGVISTAHGKIRTPAFVTVATNAAAKGGVTPDEIRSCGGEVVLANTYHLQVRGQVDAVKRGGGVARFMGWDGPTMTDSGGFQVFSLGQRLKDGIGKFANYDLPRTENTDQLRGLKRGSHTFQRPRRPLMKVDDDGVDFRSHINGQALRLTPELSIKIQQDIGADIIFTFDEPTSPVASLTYSREAMNRTHRWAERCLAEHKRQKNKPLSSSPLTKGREQALFGIVQGGPHEELRAASAQAIADMDFPGFGIGGSYHRMHKSDRFKELDWVIPHLPESKPRHFLGIGGVEDMIVAVFQGCDMFDCVIPTREARHGRLYFFNPKISPEEYFDWQYKAMCGKKPQRKQPKFYTMAHITRQQFKYNQERLVAGNTREYALSYIYHLFKTQEILAYRLATLHNLYFYFSLMAKLRTWLKNQS